MDKRNLLDHLDLIIMALDETLDYGYAGVYSVKITYFLIALHWRPTRR